VDFDFQYYLPNKLDEFARKHHHLISPIEQKKKIYKIFSIILYCLLPLCERKFNRFDFFFLSFIRSILIKEKDEQTKQ
jgi:hypothetical protein